MIQEVKEISSDKKNKFRNLTIIGFIIYEILQKMGKIYRYDFQHIASEDIKISFFENYHLFFENGDFNISSIEQKIIEKHFDKYITILEKIFTFKDELFDNNLQLEDFFIVLGVFFVKNEKVIEKLLNEIENDNKSFCLTREIIKIISPQDKINVKDYLNLLKNNKTLAEGILDDMYVLSYFEVKISEKIDDYIDYP